MAVVEALVPEVLENYVQMNRARLRNYEELRAEVVMYAEARGGVSLSVASP